MRFLKELWDERRFNVSERIRWYVLFIFSLNHLNMSVPPVFSGCRTV